MRINTLKENLNTQEKEVYCVLCKFYRFLYNDLNDKDCCAAPSNQNGKQKYILPANEKNKEKNCRDFKEAGLLRKITVALWLRPIDLSTI